MRPIDADALIEFCAERWIPLNIDAVNMQPTIQPENAQLSQEGTTSDTISRQAAIDALWQALYAYEDKTERQFQESDELNVDDWIVHRNFVQNMNDIDRQTILNMPSAQPEPSIPLSWIENEIKWLKSLDNTFSEITALQISAMVNKWRDEKK